VNDLDLSPSTLCNPTSARTKINFHQVGHLNGDAPQSCQLGPQQFDAVVPVFIGTYSLRALSTCSWPSLVTIKSAGYETPGTRRAQRLEGCTSRSGGVTRDA
jgi:hypothetical protein